MKDKRKEAIEWAKVIEGKTDRTTLRAIEWADIIGTSNNNKDGIEEGAITILRKIFDIKDEEIYGK